MPTFFIKDAGEIRSATHIRHFDFHTQTMRQTDGWLPAHRPVDIALTAGASCPDVLLDQVVDTITRWFPEARPLDEALAPFLIANGQWLIANG